MRGRKTSCGVNITAWLVEVKHPDAEHYTKVNGLSGLTRSLTATTEDGSAEGDLWAEPVVRKRAGSVELSGRPLRDETTGLEDPGQRMLSAAAAFGGCEADIDLRLSDQAGHTALLRALVESVEDEVDDKGKRAVRWKLRQVGEPEFPPYVQATSVDAPASVAVQVGGPDALVPVAVLPEDASNRRYRVYCRDAEKVVVTALTETAFCLRGLAAGDTVVTVRTVNNGHAREVAVTVTA